MIRTVCLPIVALASGIAIPAEAQEPVVFRSDVSLVRVDAQVIDRNNRAITGLQVDDFVLRDQGQPQQIRNFASEDMPVDVLLLLDVSGSMRPHVERIASAAQQALQVLGPDDRVAIMVFDRATRMRLPFRNNREDVVREFESLLRQEYFNGGTDITRGLYDAISYVAREGRRDARRAIVILTDDQTERDRDVEGVARELARADTVMSALLAPDGMSRLSRRPAPTRAPTGWPDIILGRRPPLGGGGPVILGSATSSAGTAEIAQRSGGDSLRVDEASAFEWTLARIRQRYALHYHLPEGAGQASGRSIEVELAGAARSRYPGAEVRYRRVNVAGGGEPIMISRAPDRTTVSDRAPAADRTPSSGRRRGVDETRRGPGPAASDLPPDPPSEGGWRRVNEPEPRPAAQGQSQAEPAAQEPPRGWRRLKPGEQP